MREESTPKRSVHAPRIKLHFRRVLKPCIEEDHVRSESKNSGGRGNGREVWSPKFAETRKATSRRALIISHIPNPLSFHFAP